MNYKILLVGKSEDTINRFFQDKTCTFECFTSSTIFADLANSVKYFHPGAVIYCMEQEIPEDIYAISSFMHHAKMASTPLVIIGLRSECNLYSTLTGSHVDFFLHKEEPFCEIVDQLSVFLEKNSGASSQPLWNDVLMMTDDTKADGRKRILVIDDSPAMLRVISSCLRRDYNVATAANGRVGLRYLQKKSADLILLDYEMPEENGVKVMERIRKNPDLSSIPIIFLTGVQDIAKVQKALSMKPEGYLLKPVDTAILMEKIHNALLTG